MSGRHSIPQTKNSSSSLQKKEINIQTFVGSLVFPAESLIKSAYNKKIGIKNPENTKL